MDKLDLKKKIKDFNNSLNSVEIFLQKSTKFLKISSLLKKIIKL